MTEQNREAYPIQWNAPGADTGHSTWQGPRPDAQLPQDDSAGTGQASASMPGAQQAAPQPSGLGDPWGQSSGDAGQAPDQSGAQVGWAGAASSGETAQEISQSHPQDAAYGWSGDGGSTRFDAPDRGDHAPRPTNAPEATPQAEAFAPQGGGWNVGSQAPAPQDAQPSAEQQGQQAQPASYASAPVSGSTGAGSGEQWGSNTYASAPPQVVSQHDDLPEDSLTIGRSRDNSIVLDDMLVSRRHVVITADDEGLLLRDLGSRNGTFVNGRRVEQTHLHEGDRIGIGASTFEVRDGWLVSV